jgi:FeoB-associated Cys-rich membrane protein
MNWQNIVVLLIVASALAYIGSMLWKKTKSFSPKAGCDADCGCSSKAKPTSL